jgi:hypothetical protein
MSNDIKKKIKENSTNKAESDYKFGWNAMWIVNENQFNSGVFRKKSEIPKGAFGIHRCRIYRVIT